jgi:hypothetical protein
MFKHYTANNTCQYIDGQNDMVSRYINTKHSSVKKTPVLGSKPESKCKVYMNL